MGKKQKQTNRSLGVKPYPQKNDFLNSELDLYFLLLQDLLFQHPVEYDHRLMET